MWDGDLGLRRRIRRDLTHTLPSSGGAAVGDSRPKKGMVEELLDPAPLVGVRPQFRPTPHLDVGAVQPFEGNRSGGRDMINVRWCAVPGPSQNVTPWVFERTGI